MLEQLIGEEVSIFLHYGQTEDGSPITEHFTGIVQDVIENLIILQNVRSQMHGGTNPDTKIINTKSPVFVSLETT